MLPNFETDQCLGKQTFGEDYEMDILNDLFTQWLPITLLITGTIDKRAPQPHINDLRACGFTNGLVLFFLYLGTFLFGAWGARAVLFATAPAAKKLAQLGGGPLALAKAGAGMMYFAMPALFASVFPFTVNLVHKVGNVEESRGPLSAIWGYLRFPNLLCFYIFKRGGGQITILSDFQVLKCIQSRQTVPGNPQQLVTHPSCSHLLVSP